MCASIPRARTRGRRARAARPTMSAGCAGSSTSACRSIRTRSSSRASRGARRCASAAPTTCARPDGGNVYENRYVMWGRLVWGRLKEYEVYEDTQRSKALDEWLARTSHARSSSTPCAESARRAAGSAGRQLDSPRLPGRSPGSRIARRCRSGSSLAPARTRFRGSRTASPCSVDDAVRRGSVTRGHLCRASRSCTSLVTVPGHVRALQPRQPPREHLGAEGARREAVIGCTACGAVDPTLELGSLVVFDDLHFIANRLPDGIAVHVLRRARRSRARPLDPSRRPVLAGSPRRAPRGRGRRWSRRPRRWCLRSRRRPPLQHAIRDRPARRLRRRRRQPDGGPGDGAVRRARAPVRAHGVRHRLRQRGRARRADAGARR